MNSVYVIVRTRCDDPRENGIESVWLFEEDAEIELMAITSEQRSDDYIEYKIEEYKVKKNNF